jgi:hypothetical protein
MPLKPDHLKPVTVNLNRDQLDFLESRGARSEQGRGPRGLAPTIRRGIDFLRQTLSEVSLPVSANEIALLQELIDDPWGVEVETLRVLPRIVEVNRRFPALAHEYGLIPKAFIRRLEKLSFLELLKVLDALQVAATLSSSSGKLFGEG